MLFTDLRVGQSVFIGDAKVTLVTPKDKKINRNRVRLAIDADPSIEIQFERKDNAHDDRQEP